MANAGQVRSLAYALSRDEAKTMRTGCAVVPRDRSSFPGGIEMRPLRSIFVVAVYGLACGAPATGSAPTGGDAPLADVSSPAQDACMESRAAALRDVSRIVTLHSTGCAIDGDCILESASLSCLENCDSAVLASHRTQFEQALARYASDTCSSLPSNCGSAPNCAVLAGVRCVGGVCSPVVAGTGQ